MSCFPLAYSSVCFVPAACCMLHRVASFRMLHVVVLHVLYVYFVIVVRLSQKDRMMAKMMGMSKTKIVSTTQTHREQRNSERERERCTCVSTDVEACMDETMDAEDR